MVLANLSGFDGSPESLRKLQLEYGAEIGRAIVNFDGPIVFCVVSRYHGGAFVVFSGMLNDNMEVLAVEGSYASVLGGAPGGRRRVHPARSTSGPRPIRGCAELEAAVAAADGVDAAAPAGRAARRCGRRCARRSSARWPPSSSRIHNIERAREVGSVHDIIPAGELRPYLIDAVERGLRQAGVTVAGDAEDGERAAEPADAR